MATDASTDPLKLLEMIDRVTKITKQTVESGAKLMEMQRLMVGMPQSISETRTPDKQPTTPTEQVAADLDELKARIKREALAEQVESEPEVEPVSEYIDAVSEPAADE
jgi:phage-related minor tail protein